jgi:mannose-1-phosphate guanylyltransferase
MDAIVLVGGQGTRLRPLTWHRHKSLVPICNRPAIEYLFEWLQRNGVRRVVLALGRHNEDLAEAFPPGRLPGLELLPVFEQVRLESGGAIRNAVAEAGIECTFVVLNGDVYLDFDLVAAVEAHRAAQARLTLALTPVEDPSAFGVAVLGEDGMVTGFVEKPPRGSAPGNLVNAGAWIFEPDIVGQIPPGPVRVEETLFPSLVARRQPVLGYQFEGRWADFGTAQRYLDLNLALASDHGGVVLGAGETAHAGRMTNAVVGDGCAIGDEAVLERSVLWDHVEVGRGSVVVDSVLADEVRVGCGARLEGVIAGRGAKVADGAVVPRGTVIEPGGQFGGSE